MTISGARIIVADDQRDVARTLTDPLRSAGAKLQFVESGEEALAAVRAGGVDLVVIDMKMPPGDWGGLWLLEQLRDSGIDIPALVLSGEGQQRQTVQAMRSGAKDWISKGDADTELAASCTQHLGVALDRAVDTMVASAPSPLAYAFARYQRSIGGELQYSEGLRLLEEIVRFVALIGLATFDARQDSLSTIQPARLARPSFGAWASLTSVLAKNAGASELFKTLARHVMPHEFKAFEPIIKLRNDHSHGGQEPVTSDIELVSNTVRGCAHRLSTTQFAIGSHANMRLVNDRLEIAFKEHRGITAPRPAEVTLAEPEFLKSPDPYLYTSGGQPTHLEPWFGLTDGRTGSDQTLAVFDGIKSARPNVVSDTDTLFYTHPATGERRQQRSDRTTTWSDVVHLFNS